MCAVASPHANIDMLRLLIENGADVNATEEKYQTTVLGLAVQSGNLDKIKFILDAGADINYQTSSGYDVLIYAMYGRDIAKDENLIAIINLLIQRGAKLNGVTSYGESALRVASNKGRFDAVKILLAAGADPEQLEWTELMSAIAFGSLADVQVLLDAGAELSDIDYWERTPWLLSLQVGDLAKVKLLLSSGVNCNDCGRCKKAALMYVIENNHVELLKWLIDEGFDIEATNEFGTTPLMVAVECNNVECVKILLEAGAKPGRKDNCNSTAINLASNIQIVRMLLDAGEDLNDVNDDVRRLLTGVGNSDLLNISKSQYLAGKHRQFGKSNPEVMEVAFWKAMVSGGFGSWYAKKTFNDTNLYSPPPVWCFDRFGRTITQLPDGRIVEIGGEHEDYYDPDFCIYNDVVVYQGDGSFQILGYPKDIFPPTDFHSATLVGEYIYIIGSVGYRGERIYNHTPVYRLHTDTFKIEKVKTSGGNPGWISRHKAYYQEPAKICITGGKFFDINNQEPQLVDNLSNYTLDLTNLYWTRINT
ncbi:ankyrin repeat domain-containing protein [Nostoc sp. CCY0012]|uniref:ankyrin repeat domain-containing protein n=1 Tax=Nostoc sp. CCY0012 TaxID=1056123 RepID=UPI0039C60365